MKTKDLNAKVFPYILDCIDSEPYEVKTETEKEKLEFLYNTFISESWHEYNQKYYKGNIVNGFAGWIAGLPSIFNIDFTNFNVLQLAVLWGSVPEDACEKQEEKILNNWFNFIACKTFQLFKKYKIT